MACNGWCNGCEHSVDYCRRHNPEPDREACAYCDELTPLDEISEYINEDDSVDWVCDACVARGVFDEDDLEEIYEALEARNVRLVTA